MNAVRVACTRGAGWVPAFAGMTNLVHCHRNHVTAIKAGGWRQGAELYGGVSAADVGEGAGGGGVGLAPFRERNCSPNEVQ